MAVVSYAPMYRLVRTVKADDASLPTEKRYGINVADFDEVDLMVSLHNSATVATVEPYFWSEEADAFLPEHESQSVEVSTPGMVVRMTVRRHGSVYFAVTGIAGGVDTDDRVKLEVAGVPSYDKVG